MVAELTLFLTKDREVQVRAFTTKRGKEVFCIKDFIRQTASKTMGPNDAVVYWLSCLGKLMHEDAILDQYMVKFPGPYEQANVCIRAEGLVLLYAHMCERFAWVEKKYQSEIRNVLFAIVERKTATAYMEMFDDGEVDELMVERGDRSLACPPEGSRFNYVEPELDAKLKVAEAEKQRAVNELIAKLEAKTLALDEANAKLREKEEEEQDAKRHKKDGFTVADVLKAKNLPLDSKEVFCKRLISKFKTAYPDRRTFKRHDTSYFYAEDRQIVEELAVAEYEMHLLAEGKLDV
jgi:hypothetical protein